MALGLSSAPLRPAPPSYSLVSRLGSTIRSYWTLVGPSQGLLRVLFLGGPGLRVDWKSLSGQRVSDPLSDTQSCFMREIMGLINK